MKIIRLIRKSQFDSEIMRANRSNVSDYFIRFRLHLIRRGTRGGKRPFFYDEGEKWNIEEWGNEEWSQFERRVKTSIERIFNSNRLYLQVPHRLVNDFQSKETYHESTHPALKCKLKIILERSRDNAHGELMCVKNPTDGSGALSFRSFALRNKYHSRGVITNLDVETERIEEGGHVTRQCVVAHEFAHMLGVGHPGGAFSNEDWAYGRPGTAAWRSLSGAGNTVGPRELKAWRDRIVAHTHVRFGWRYITTRDRIDSFLRPSGVGRSTTHGLAHPRAASRMRPIIP